MPAALDEPGSECAAEWRCPVTENDTISLLILAWLLVTLTRLTLAHRRAVQAATRKAAKETSP